jgi:hypothetical protein
MQWDEHINVGGTNGSCFTEGILPSIVPGKGRKVRIQGQVTQISAGSANEISKYETEEEDNGGTMNVESDALKHAYKDETWFLKCFFYNPKLWEFIGRRGIMQFFEWFPTILQLFEFFWPFNLLCKIVMETNCYATEPLDAQGNTSGGPKWETFTILELKAFLAIYMYMAMNTATKLQVLFGESRHSFP